MAAALAALVRWDVPPCRTAARPHWTGLTRVSRWTEYIRRRCPTPRACGPHLLSSSALPAWRSLLLPVVVACAQSHAGHERARLRLARAGASGGRPVGRGQFGTHTSMRLRQVSRISMKGNYQSACKPGSVWSCLRDGHSSGTTLARRLVQPTRVAGQETGSAPRVATHARPPLFGLAPGGVYPATPVSRRAVRSYRTLSPLPRRPKPTWRFAFCGTFPGVAPGGR